MEIEIIRIEEYKDGSADVEVHMDEKTKLFLINHAFIDILSKSLDEFEEKFMPKIKWTDEKGAE
jgi:hypothetical protein